MPIPFEHQTQYIGDSRGGAGYLTFISRSTTTPPGSPSPKDCYLIPTGLSGWGVDGVIFFRHATDWEVISPKLGMLGYVEDEDLFVAFDGEDWYSVPALSASGGGGGSVDGFEGSGSILRFAYGNSPASGLFTQVGVTLNNQGSGATPTIATTNRITRSLGRHTRSTGAGAGASAGLQTQQGFSRDVGFTYEFRGGIETMVSGVRLFIGVRGSTGLTLNADPSSWASIVGFGLDAADTNIQFMHNDASGTATKVDTGIAKAAGDELYVRIHCEPGGDFEVMLAHFAGSNLTDAPTGTPFTATVSTDIPAPTQACIAGHAIGNAATASAALIAMIRETYRAPF